jgi:lipopolysaccharide transport system ATP-binding protein
LTNTVAAGSMSDVVIAVENLSKRYLVGHRSARLEGYTTLRDTIGREARNFARKALDAVRGRQIVQGDEVEEFWALRDVSFEVRQGDVLGIIGRNGAGKSTLLKILSRITEPTEGRAEIRGRVASLLEVGTGFHPELTGRENVYLNGAILGMTRAEIRTKFDEIVAFAGVEKFLDTPVKHFSSGMYVRLAFAVAAHLEPEILVVDEVLAVGDDEFQKKCLGKMSEVAEGGRTILFVSHNLQAIRTLCDSIVVLDAGKKVFEGGPERAIQSYLADSHLSNAIRWARPSELVIDKAGFDRVSVSLTGEQPFLRLQCSIWVRVDVPSSKSFLAVDITDSIGTGIMQALPQVKPFVPSAAGQYELSLEIALPPMIPGIYWLNFWLGPHNTHTYDFVQKVVCFEVTSSPTPGRVFPHTIEFGYIVPESKCTLIQASHISERFILTEVLE